MTTSQNNTVPKCCRCGKKKSVKLRRQINGSGSQVFIWYCVECGHNADNKRPFIKKALIESWIANGRLPSIAAIPIANDYSENHTCIVCGSNGAELHHWFPQSLSPLIDNHGAWPTNYLCKPCHEQWHKIVTPYLTGKNWREKYESITNVPN